MHPVILLLYVRMLLFLYLLYIAYFVLLVLFHSFFGKSDKNEWMLLIFILNYIDLCLLFLPD
jgi:hypothetical protein